MAKTCYPQEFVSTFITHVYTIYCNTIIFQYYDDTYPTVKEQKEFEKNLFNKTSRVNGKDVSWFYDICVHLCNCGLAKIGGKTYIQHIQNLQT